MQALDDIVAVPHGCLSLLQPALRTVIMVQSVSSPFRWGEGPSAAQQLQHHGGNPGGHDGAVAAEFRQTKRGFGYPLASGSYPCGLSGMSGMSGRAEPHALSLLRKSSSESVLSQG